MELTFYKQAATPNRVDKSHYLNLVGTLSNVVLKDDTDLMSPTFILKTSPVVYNSNYLYCSFTHRYYYINEVIAMSGGRVAINCSVDVLYTYKDEIYNSYGWISKGPHDDADDLMHNDYPFQQNYEIFARDIQSAYNPFAFEFNPTGTLTYTNVILILK